MSSHFVSQIPKNKLEPVYLGGGSGANLYSLKTAAQSCGGGKSNGVYVPVHLRGSIDQSSRPETIKKPISLGENDFPGLPTKKTASKAVTKPIMNYAEMAKKEGVVREPVKFKPLVPSSYQKRDTRNWGDQEEEFDYEYNGEEVYEEDE